MQDKQITIPHVFIAIPSGDMLHADFSMSLAAMLMYSFANTNIDISFSNSRGSDIARNRNELMNGVINANKNGTPQTPITHILMLDSDIVFPPDLIEKFLGHDKNFVAACYSRRVEPFDVVGVNFEMGHSSLKIEQRDDKFLRTMIFAPVGCALMRVECLERLELPFFAFETINYFNTSMHQDNYYKRIYGDVFDTNAAEKSKALFSISEDHYFIARLRAAEVDIWCDLIMTKQISHIGIKQYTL